MIAGDNKLAFHLCKTEAAVVCQFASWYFDEKARTETLKIAFTQENEFLEFVCPHSHIYLQCNQGCAEAIRAIEEQQTEDESYPVMLGPVTEETIDEMFRRYQTRHCQHTIYLPTQI